MEVLQRLLQDKANEVQELQKKVSDVEREKHTDLVKLRLEVRMLPDTHRHVHYCQCILMNAHIHIHN